MAVLSDCFMAGPTS